MKWTDTGNKMQISISDERIGLPVSKHGLIGIHRVVREGSIWLTLVNTPPRILNQLTRRDNKLNT